MRLRANKPIFAAFLGLIVTSFVTGCVKNNSKDGSKDSINLKQESLTLSSTENGAIHKLQHQDNIAYKTISKEWIFSLERDMDVRISRESYTLGGCTSQDFFYRFEAQKVNTTEVINILPKSNISLKQGTYTLKAIVDNRGLCKNIDMSFVVKMIDSQSLSFNGNIKSSFTCMDLKDGQSQVFGDRIEIYTSPMALYRVSNNTDQLSTNPPLNHNYLCGREKRLSITDHCNDFLPLHDIKNAITVQQHQCQKPNGSYTLPARLELISKNGAIEGQFRCRYRGRHSNYNFSQCEVNYNLGEKFPVTRVNQPNIFFHIKKRQIDINFNFNRDNIDMSRIPKQLYVNLYNIRTQELVFQKSTQIPSAKLINGEIKIYSQPGEKGIRKKLKNINLSNLYLVISTKSASEKTGLYHFGLSELCLDYPHKITRDSLSQSSQTIYGCQF